MSYSKYPFFYDREGCETDECHLFIYQVMDTVDPIFQEWAEAGYDLEELVHAATTAIRSLQSRETARRLANKRDHDTGGA